MVLAKDQISLINVNDGYVGEDGKSYVLNITGGQRSITYNEVGSNPTPSPSAFSCEFFVNGALTNPTVYSWSATGHLSGTSSTNSFTPSYAASFNSSFSNSVVLSAVYNGITFRAVAPIAITKIGEIRYTWIKYADDVSGGGLSDSSVGKKYIGIAINKTTSTESSIAGDYAWSMFEGPVGPGGADGDTSYLHVAYATNSTGTAGFSTTVSTAKTYLGQYTDFNPTSSSNPALYNWTLIKGADGYTPVKGTDYFDGINGTNGANGISSYLWIRYSQNVDGSSMTTSPTGAKYIGTATTTTAVAPTLYTSYNWTLIKGTDGISGEDGIDGQTSYLHIKYSNDGGTTFTATTGETVGDWIGTYVDFTPADSISVSAYTWNKVKGEVGNDGVSIVSVNVWYYLSTSATVLSGGTWVDTAPAWVSGKYMWSKTITTYSSGSPTESAPACITGAQGVTGNTGATGKGISSTVVTYQSHTNGTTAPTGTWVASVPTVTAGNYLWTKTYITYTDAQTSTIYSVALMGATGSTGATGTTGTTITSVAITYQVHTNGTTPPTSTWLGSIPTVTASQYLWTRTVTTYSNIATTTAYSVGMMGATGSTGATGTTGATGKGVTSISEEYQISSSKTVAPTTFSATRPTWTAGNYIWTRSKIVYNNPTSTVYTTPVVSSEWEAVNEIQVGGRNLLLNSDIIPTDLKSGQEFLFESPVTATTQLVSGKKFPVGSYIFNIKMKKPVGDVVASIRFSKSSGAIAYYGKIQEIDGGWNDVQVEFDVIDENETYSFQIYNHAFGVDFATTVSVKEFKIERGNIVTDWTPAPEDIDAQLGEKATNDAVNKIAEDLGALSGTVDDKASAGALSDLENAYLLRISQQALAELATTEALENLDGRTTIVEGEFGAKKVVWSFIENRIEAGEEGIFIGDKETQMGIFISVLPDPSDATKKIGRISFLDSGNEAAYISNNIMQINHGIFVESAIIGKHKIETIANTDISVFKYIG